MLNTLDDSYKALLIGNLKRKWIVVNWMIVLGFEAKVEFPYENNYG